MHVAAGKTPEPRYTNIQGAVLGRCTGRASGRDHLTSSISRWKSSNDLDQNPGLRSRISQREGTMRSISVQFKVQDSCEAEVSLVLVASQGKGHDS
jgi:hypothetical protein